MSTETTGTRYLRRSILAIGLLLPSLSLVPIGSFWLWQHGLLIPWAILACVSTFGAFLFQYWLLRPQRGVTLPAVAPTVDDPTLPLSPRETLAWNEVERIAQAVTPAELASRDAALNLGTTVIDTVARKIHPDVKEPLWQFTAPEALALAERVSQRMRPFIIENVPLGDRLTIGQFMTLFRWSPIIDKINKAYDIWRIVRLINPLSAATNEIRERLSKEMYEWGRDELARRIARAYVREVGRAAIDLYSGRLRVTAQDLESFVSRASKRDEKSALAKGAEPLRILVAGQTGVGKSSLVNALIQEVRAASDTVPTTADFTAYRLTIEGVSLASLIDGPGYDVSDGKSGRWLEAALESDLILWLLSAARADRQPDTAALARFRRLFEERLDRRRPGIVFVATQIDRLRPFREWSPPYDLRDGDNAKAVSIRQAVNAISADLAVPDSEIVPVCLDPAVGLYNVDALWAKIMENVSEAQRARVVRSLVELRSEKRWGSMLKQAVGAGRVLVNTLRQK